MNQHTPDKGKQHDLRVYVTGFVLAVVLSAIPFGALIGGFVSRAGLLWTIGICAIIQVIVHFRFFLHIDFQKSHRDDLQLILFSSLIVLLMVGGTLWILGSQQAMMM